MKKNIFAFALAFSLALGVTGQGISHANEVYADEIYTEATSLETAISAEFDKDYSIVWSENATESWNKIKLDQNGILEITFQKVSHDMLGLFDAYIEVYDEQGECIYGLRNSDKSITEAHMFVGLEKGTYYVKLESEYVSYAYNKTTVYSFSFTANSRCELENNNIKEYATPMKVGESYTGFFGTGYMVINENRDVRDLYEVQLKKGQVYKLTFNKEVGTTIVKLLGENVDLGALWPSDDADNFCIAPNDEFIAPYSGTYYLHIHNYGNEQYKYTTKITNVTPKPIALSSVKGEKKAFTAKWKKASCTGYQIQYSTNKNFKNAKSVSVGVKKTSAKITKLTSNKKYYVRIRTYKIVGDKTAYSSWSKATSVTVK